MMRSMFLLSSYELLISLPQNNSKSMNTGSLLLTALSLLYILRPITHTITDYEYNVSSLSRPLKYSRVHFKMFSFSYIL